MTSTKSDLTLGQTVRINTSGNEGRIVGGLGTNDRKVTVYLPSIDRCVAALPKNLTVLENCNHA